MVRVHRNYLSEIKLINVKIGIIFTNRTTTNRTRSLEQWMLQIGYHSSLVCNISKMNTCRRISNDNHHHISLSLWRKTAHLWKNKWQNTILNGWLFSSIPLSTLKCTIDRLYIIQLAQCLRMGKRICVQRRVTLISK